jgi:asparagine synthase (glutamine-hydrolysing)
MCGIIALASLGLPVTGQLIAATLEPVRHRGPDGEGAVFFRGGDAAPVVCGGPDTPQQVYQAGLPFTPNGEVRGDKVNDAFLALGHRRLSILDLSATGHQPMCTRNGRVWITYNGEIYNYLELRDELRQHGYEFVTDSDTEVILAAYQTWGLEFLHKLNGMFSFVLFDRASRRLLAARDRFGIKPLYYWTSPAGFIAFGSEIKQFSVLPGWQPRLNGQRAYDFLNWNVIDHTDETLFRDVYQVRGGELIALDFADLAQRRPPAGSRLPANRWYNLRASSFEGGGQETAARFRELFEDAVRIHLRSDVSVGSCLSGGLDSSSIVCVINRQLRETQAGGRQKTFSAYAEPAQYDERPFIRDVVQATGSDAHYVSPDPAALFEQLDQITWHQDEPFGSTSIFAQWMVFGLARRQNVKVMLDGQGADELLAGYHSYFGTRFAQLAREMRFGELRRELNATMDGHRYPLTWCLQQCANFLLPQTLRQPLRRLVGKASAKPDWINLSQLGAEPRDPFVTARAATARSVSELSRAQLVYTALPTLLHCEDRDSMAHSIEARVPFLDHRLVEFSLGLRDEQKIARGLTKRILRDAMKGILPESVRNRQDKLGFVTPEEIWMRESCPEAFRQALKDACEAAQGALDMRLSSHLEAMIGGQRPFSHTIWRAISFGRWLNVFGLKI